MVRLYVGGLPTSVDERELAARFTPFGAVIACEFLAPKPQGIADFPPVRRGFAYVELDADDGAIKKCLSVVRAVMQHMHATFGHPCRRRQYQHSKWKGHQLRVEMAHPDYLARLKREWEVAQETEAAEEAKAEATEAEREPPSKKPLYFPIPGRKRKVEILYGVRRRIIRGLTMTVSHTCCQYSFSEPRSTAASPMEQRGARGHSFLPLVRLRSKA